MDDANKKALLAFAESQILAAQKLIASLQDDEAEEPVVEQPAKRGPGRPRKNAAAPVKPAKVAEPEPEEDDDDEEETSAVDARRAELSAMKITALRSLALKLNFQADGVKAASKEDLVDAILDDEFSGEDTSADDDDDDEAVTYTRADLKGKGIRELKSLAKQQGHTPADLSGLSIDDVIDLLVGDADDDSDDDDDDSGEDENRDYYTRADFEGMSLAELKAIGRQYEKDYPGWIMPTGIKKPALIELLLEDGDEGDEE